jgi:hypothetical protein
MRGKQPRGLEAQLLEKRRVSRRRGQVANAPVTLFHCALTPTNYTAHRAEEEHARIPRYLVEIQRYVFLHVARTARGSLNGRSNPSANDSGGVRLPSRTLPCPAARAAGLAIKAIVIEKTVDVMLACEAILQLHQCDELLGETA